jgi:PAS domain S-box-containing protein
VDRAALHDAANDLAVALASVYGYVDGKLQPTAASLADVLESLENLNAFLATLRPAPAESERSKEDLLNAIIEGSPYAKILVNDAGKITLVNRQAEKLFDYSREELLGQSIDLLVPERFRRSHPELRASFEHAPMARPMGAGRDLFGRRKDGSEVPIEIGLNPIKTGAGSFTVAAITDITERKRAEELRLLHAGIQQHAAEVEELNRELARASKFKSQFVATMSHELRTPLTAIVGAVELLGRGRVDERGQVHVQTINEAAEALLAIINSILDLSKIEAGMLDLQTNTFFVEDVLDGAADVSAQLASGKPITLHTYVDPLIPPVQGDSDRLRQILLNLLGNAVKFTDRGQVVARAMPLDRLDHTIKIRFEVQDTGIGIPADVQAQLFEPFVQGDASSTRKVGGTGLGLSISKRLVELMGGEIGLVSEPGAGALFWFTITFAVAPDSAAAQKRSLDGVWGLIVTDDDVFANIVQRYMMSWGMETRRATNRGDVLSAPSHAGSMVLAIVDVDALDKPETTQIIDAVRTTMPGRVITIGGGGALRKPLRQSYLFDAIVSASGIDPGPIAPAAPLRAPASASVIDAPVLVAEDNMRLQRLLKMQFDELGVPVTFASDGRQAVEAVRRGEYSMVLMDCQMPNMDGLAATRAIRASEEGTGRHIPIAAMTANAFDEDRNACLEAGMDDHLGKPIKLAGLRTMIERWSKRRLPDS